MRCLLTGATGYIGGHLARRLAADGHRVQAIVRRRERPGVDPIAELARMGIEIIEGSLLDERLIKTAVADAELVFHLAWQTNRPSLPQVQGGGSDEQFRANVGGMQTLVAAAARASVRRFVFASTVAMYGNAGGEFTLQEEDALENAAGLPPNLAAYVAPKIAAEKLLAEQLSEPDHVTLRLAKVHGPLAPDTVETVRYAIGGRPAFGAAPRLQNVHIEDAVEALMLAAIKPEAANKTFNIAGNETIGYHDYLEALRRIATWMYRGKPPTGHGARLTLLRPRYETARARRELGFSSSVALLDALEEMVEAALPALAPNGDADRRPRHLGWAPTARPDASPVRAPEPTRPPVQRNPTNAPEPLFILAPGRSFTSVVSAMLGQHPQMYGLPELYLNHADTMREWWIKCRTGLHHGLIRALAELYGGGQTEENIGEAYRWIRGHILVDTCTVFHGLIERIAPRVAVEKSPYSPRDDNIARLGRLFPNARFIHLVRHPRGTCSSIVKTDWVRQTFMLAHPDKCDFSTNPPTLDPGMAWFEAHERIRRFTDSLPPGQSLRIIGEQLLMEPDRQLRAISTWLGLRCDEAAIDAMKHPEESPFSCLGPPNARYGADVGFLQNPALRPFAGPPESLEGPLPWRADDRGFAPNVKALAREFGYQ
jgi:nucleoside-diphosphate-sugar epimerase